MFKFLVVGTAAAYAVYRVLFGGGQGDPPPSTPKPQEPTYPRPPIRRYDERVPSYPPQPYERISSQPPAPRHDERQYQRNVEPFQTDHTPEVETYASLRDRAKKEGDLMSQCYQYSKDAYGCGDGALAKVLSERGKRHELRKDELNAQASAIVFKENNQNQSACNVDLHGLYVKEAIAYSEKAIEGARRRGESEIRLIVGQGTHSDGGVARLKPAVQKDMQMRGFGVRVDPRNPGVLVVRLDDR